MASNTVNIHKLQTAINGKGYNVLYSTSQFYSFKQDRPITIYQLRRAIWDEETQKSKSVEIFKSTSQLQILLFLRDLWYEINGWEVPTDNEMWNKAKERYYEKQAMSEDVQ